MRHSSTTPALLAFANLAAASVLHDARGPCNANNCARAVTGTRDKEPNQTVRWADCVSFLRTTVTPDVVTSTITATVPATATAVTVVQVTTTTTVPPDYPNKAKRAVTVTPSVVPAYASACTGPAAYSSACSCWGVSAQTSTAAAPTVYVTATTTVTETTVTRTSTTAVATQTVVADASCNGRPLGTQWQYCADDSRYACKCGKDTGGAVVCFRIPLSQLNCFTSEYPPCNRNADCASGRRCQTAEYSACSRNSCDPVGPGYCAAAKVGLAVAAAMVELSRAGAQVAVPAE